MAGRTWNWLACRTGVFFGRANAHVETRNLNRKAKWRSENQNVKNGNGNGKVKNKNRKAKWRSENQKVKNKNEITIWPPWASVNNEALKKRVCVGSYTYSWRIKRRQSSYIPSFFRLHLCYFKFLSYHDFNGFGLIYFQVSLFSYLKFSRVIVLSYCTLSFISNCNVLA